MKSVSVIIPTYNRANIVCEAIQSVLNQDVDDCSLEIIVVDDGSTDNTREVVTAFGGNVKYIFLTKQGPGIARNRGIDEATGEWVAFLDSDDIWLPDKLSLQFKVLEAFPQFNAIHSNFFGTMDGKLVSSKGLETWVEYSRFDSGYGWNDAYSNKYSSVQFGIRRSGEPFDIHTGNIFASLLMGCCAACWTLLVRKDILGDHIRFHITSPRWQDYWFYCQLSEYSDIIFLDCPTVEQRGHTGKDRLTLGQIDKSMECYLDICTKIYLPSQSKFRPKTETIIKYIQIVKTRLLEEYLKTGNRLKAKSLIRTKHGFKMDTTLPLYWLAAWLPFDLIKFLCITKKKFRVLQ